VYLTSAVVVPKLIYLAVTVLSVSEHQAEHTVRHHHLNDVIARSLASAGVPVSKEPSGLSRPTENAKMG